MVCTAGRLVPSGNDERAIATRTPKERSMLMFLASIQNLLAQRLKHDDRGATAVEYGLIVAVVAVVIAVSIATVGTDIKTAFTTLAGNF
jgi:pilus assembly protein Flp/PilA